MSVPVVNTLNEQVHLVVCDERWLIEGLQKKTCLAIPNVGEFIGRPRNLEPKRHIELDGSRQVRSEDKGLDFDCGEIQRILQLRGLTYS